MKHIFIYDSVSFCVSGLVKHHFAGLMSEIPSSLLFISPSPRTTRSSLPMSPPHQQSKEQLPYVSDISLGFGKSKVRVVFKKQIQVECAATV
jgi:hypothetical protein